MKYSLERTKMVRRSSGWKNHHDDA